MNRATPPARTIVLLAHGSRDPLWRMPIEAVADQIRARQPDAVVCCAYLEMCSPSLPDAAASLIAGGALEIRVFPLFLGVGKHAREDLPLLLASIRADHPEVVLELLPTAGEDERLIALMADIALQ
ncbi:MAG: CbiX/SirB N-terminal domain-containing protein [Polaromonas sp.]